VLDALFVAAEAREFAGLLQHCRRVVALGWPVEWVRMAALDDREVILAANGAGPRRSAALMEVAQPRIKPAAVVSTGFCGGLDPEYRVGDVFVANRIQGADIEVQKPLLRRPRRFVEGVLASVDRVVGSLEEKARLRASGASAVEMEAAGVVPRVRQWELPFYCIRVVTDRADERFTLDYNAARLPDGRFSVPRILGAALWQPASGIPELVRLGRNSATASRALGDFIADCHF
jgi:adenosylhomocysteine nucleosidase